ncbi:MAG TPA: hypothetical protein VFN44_14230 [Solirubrobacteraceae bacterium]|nr:hypothetical protein [Solirubrobacteraceae bacterium]
MQTAVHPVRPRRLRALAVPCAAVVAALALSGPASAATAAPAPSSAAPISAAPLTTTQGIIMRDGGVCDPIRHMGC